MNSLQQEHIRKTAVFVKSKLEGEGTGHDFFHIERVWKNAKIIGQKEGADLYIVELAALLHDISDHKFNGGDLTAGSRISREFLASIGVERKIIDAVCFVIDHVSFKGAHVKEDNLTLETKAVQDADRLDALGAIGIARAFAYGGHKGRELYNPSIKPVLHYSFEAYKANKGTTLNHFYEKLLLLKDKMKTATGKKLAEERHVYMQQFVDRFLLEWEAKN